MYFGEDLPNNTDLIKHVTFDDTKLDKNKK
jgi:hypothetical protein